jgi:hypothetical protein
MQSLLSSHAKEPHACRKRNVEIKAAKPTVHSLLICARRAMIRTTRTHVQQRSAEASPAIQDPS